MIGKCLSHLKSSVLVTTLHNLILNNTLDNIVSSLEKVQLVSNKMNKNVVAISGHILTDNGKSSIPSKNIVKSQVRCRRPWVFKSFQDFSATTSLHGYSYMINKELPWIERAAWVLIVIAALIIVAVLLWLTYLWSQNSTITVIESKHFPTGSVPFPAVTICNINKISLKAALKLANELKRPDNMTSENLSQLFRLILHFEGIGIAEPSEYMKLNNILRINKLNINAVLAVIRPKCADMLDRCMWKGTQQRCDTLFQEVNTTEGVCCSFNFHAFAKNNFPMKSQALINDVPEKVTACGYQSGLTVLLNPNTNDYHSTLMSAYGFRIALHDSYNFHDDNSDIKYISKRSEILLSVQPESSYSTSNIFNIPLNERDCAFDNEIKLFTMQKYTYINCMTECRSKLFYELCKCVPHNLPNNGSFPACSMNQLGCIRANVPNVEVALPGTNSSQSKLNITMCNCKPDCALMQYQSEISSVKLNRTFSIAAKSLFKDINLTDQSLVHIFYNDLILTRYRKDITQTWINKIASFGGLLGLFLGFSFVALFELIYFFTIRAMMSNCRNNKDAKRKIANRPLIIRR